MEFTGPHDTTVPAPVTPTVQVSWSQPRAWHGDTVQVRVRMALVKMGYTLEISISGQGAPAPFHGPIRLPINAMSMDHSYTIDWSNRTIPANTQAFIATARVVQYNISANSDPLLVDVVEPVFSA